MKNRKGFTLLEMIIALVIVSIILGFAVGVVAISMMHYFKINAWNASVQTVMDAVKDRISIDGVAPAVTNGVLSIDDFNRSLGIHQSLDKEIQNPFCPNKTVYVDCVIVAKPTSLSSVVGGDLVPVDGRCNASKGVYLGFVFINQNDLDNYSVYHFALVWKTSDGQIHTFYDCNATRSILTP